MMNNDTRAYRRWRRRALTVIGLAATTATAAAVPALAHPIFSNDPPGFPNPQGSTTSPYPAGSSPTLTMFLPFEQQGMTFNGADNTTVDTQVSVPAGWTNPACGTASTSVGNRQVGTLVPGWTCAIETVSGHQVLHWHGPQIGPPPLSGDVDSAQLFTFQVTVPSPTTTISYGATGSLAEGFFVQQVYADGTTELWRSPNDTTRPPTAQVAFGLVRTVAGAPTPTPTPPPTPTPTPTPAPTPTPTPTPTLTPTVTPTPTPTPTVTPTPTPGATATTTTLLQPIVKVRHFACEILGMVLGQKARAGDCSVLIATVTPPDATGTVQFKNKVKDKTTALGDPARVRPGGLTVLITKKLAGGEHSLTAIFIPKDPTAFKPSTSNTVKVEPDND